MWKLCWDIFDVVPYLEILCHAYVITVPGGLRVPLIKLAQSAGPTSDLQAPHLIMSCNASSIPLA